MEGFEVITPITLAERQRYFKPKVSIYGINGVVRFNKPAVNLLDIKEGDMLEFYASSTDPNIWYVAKSDNGFRVYDNKLAKYVNSLFLVRKMFGGINYSSGTGSMDFGDKEVRDGKTFFKLTLNNLTY